jgi:flagellar motor switch protein FliM
MAKILSQDEIDALLNTVSAGEDLEEQLSDGEESFRSIVAYDFKHPNRVSKDQIRNLEGIHDNFAGHLGSSLSTITRAMVDMHLVSVDQITYSEFLMSLANPSCTYTVDIDPLQGACIIDFNPTLSFLFIDRMFGGVGKILETDRELTGIEKSVMMRIANTVFEELGTAWTHIESLEFKQIGFETNPQFVQIIPPGETVIVISFQMKMLGSSGLLTICYPYVTLEPVIDKLTAQQWTGADDRSDLDENQRQMENNLQKVNMEMTATLGEASLTVHEFLKLKVGDVVTIDRKSEEAMEMSVNSRAKFLARPGLRGKHRGCEIVGTCIE